MIDGKTLIGWGIKPGPWFKAMIEHAAQLEAEGADEAAIKTAVLAMLPKSKPVIARRISGKWAEAIEVETDADAANLAAVRAHMAELTRNPMIEHAAIMPDACPAGSQPGTIPVGGAVISRAIHPAFHSSDICCSMHVSLWRESAAHPAVFLNKVFASTRFGPGGRLPERRIADPITDEIEKTRNPFLMGLVDRAKAQLADQGDGNHFAYLGRLTVTREMTRKLGYAGHASLQWALDAELDGIRSVSLLALVTHHGSRDLGAQVYKRGQEAAVQHTREVSPDTPANQAWLDPGDGSGANYWDALDYVRRWTKRNHELIHEQVGKRLDCEPIAQFGNEHNFIWQRGDRFWHGKGATPAWPEDIGVPSLGVIPLSMASPILLTLGRDREEFCSFSPHGAGRNISRTALLKEVGLHGLPPDQYLIRSRELLERQTEGLDIRFFFDRPDVSETPMAYKPAEQVRAQIERFGLCEIIAEIQPLGCIMAGDYDRPWLMKKARKA